MTGSPKAPSRARYGLSLAVPLLILLLGLPGCGGDDGPAGPGSETLASLAVTPLGIVEAGEPVDLLVEAVGSRGTRPFLLDGPVVLSVDRGTVTPGEFSLTGGTGRGAIRLSALDSTVVLTASVDAGAVAGTARIHLSPIAILAGGPSDPVEGAIPDVSFSPRPGDYRDGHPTYPDARISFNTLTVLFALGTTVGEANALLTPLQPEIVGGHRGVAGSIPGILVLRVPSTDHATMTAMIDRLVADPRVEAAIPDEAFAADVQPKDGTRIHSDWVWERTPAGGNWGLEACRVPALWNFNPMIEKAGTGGVALGMIDTGQFPHGDLGAGRMVRLNPGFEDTHGTHVAGTMVATFDNGIGIEGVHPYATLRSVSDTTFTDQWQRDAIRRILDSAPQTQVINISLGTLWRTTNPGSHAPTQTLRNVQGILADIFLQQQRARGRNPIVCVAAGNASANPSLGLVDARWSTQWTNAALVRNIEQILVVENVQQVAGDPTATTRAASSNINGFLSAPGTNILSTWSGNGYAAISGTSMASPFMAGVVGYLRSLEPGLTAAEIRQVLTRTAVPAGGGASDRIDAFAAALAIDGIRNSDTVVRRLLDIDDGTVDGNRRVAFDSSADYREEDADGDGGIGDGVVDMSDFRRWRDWYLVTHPPAGLSLDGTRGHPKKDPNASGFEDPPAEENTWPRGDFNGDGQLSLDAKTAVPGYFSGAAMTDLEMLQALFDDPDVVASELPGLIESGDVHVDLSGFLGTLGSVSARIRVVDGITDALFAERIATSAADPVVITVPTGFTRHRVVVEGRNAEGAVVCTDDTDFLLSPGEDVYLEPVCTQLEIETSFPLAVEAGTPAPLIVTAYRRNDQGGRDPAPGIGIELLATGGSVVPGSGTTNGSGGFTAEVTLEEPATNVTVFVTGTDPDNGEAKTVSVSANVFVPGGRALAVEARVNGRAEAVVGADRDNQATDEFGPPFSTYSIQHSASAADRGATAQAESSWDVAFDVDGTTGEFRSITFQGNASSMGTKAEVDGEIIAGCAGSGMGFQVVLDVVDAPVTYVLRGSITPAQREADVKVRIREGLPDGGWAFPHLFESEVSFDTSGQLLPGRYMIQGWCQTSACGHVEITSDSGSLSGAFEILTAP